VTIAKQNNQKTAIAECRRQKMNLSIEQKVEGARRALEIKVGILKERTKTREMTKTEQQILLWEIEKLLELMKEYETNNR